MIVACNNLNKFYGNSEILRDISFLINENDKIAIVGDNGAGKTTLLNIISGTLEYDGGNITSGLNCAYLAQFLEYNENNTIKDELMSSVLHVKEIEKKLRYLEHEMSKSEGEQLEKFYKEYNAFIVEFEALNGYEIESRIKGIINELDFDENHLVKNLSGGQKTKLSFGKLLLQNPDILLLDEPTNHLDIESIFWLENYLQSYKGCIVFISHDRYFIDKVATKIFEIENKKLTVYNTNYSEYKIKKELDYEINLKHFNNQQIEIKRQEEIIKTFKQYNSEKALKRARSREKALAKVERLEKPFLMTDSMKLIFEPDQRSGFDVLTARDLSKSYGDNKIFQNVDFVVHKGEKVVILGENGIGKTTLLKIILNLVEKDTGEVYIGSNVKIAYYSQELEYLNENKTVLEEIHDNYPNLTNTELRTSLAAFLFFNEDINKKISSLSGGERGRLVFLKLFMQKPNFLILDEPTNHLDLRSKEILEKALRETQSTILFVSHDRFFISEIANRVFEMKKDCLNIYELTYNEYVEMVVNKAKEIEVKEVKKEVDKDYVEIKKNNNKVKSDKQKQEKLEATILQFENKILELDAQLHETNTDYTKANDILKQKTTLENELMLLYEELE